MLYLSFLRYAAVIFAFLCVILGLPLVWIYVGNGEFFEYGTLRKATLGNYGPLYAEAAILAEGVEYDQGFTNETIEVKVASYFRGFHANATLNPFSTELSGGFRTKDRELIALAFLDAAVCVAAYIAALAAISAQAALTRAAARDVITVSDYTVQVQGLPAAATSDQVAEFFEAQVGPVAKISVQRDCRRLIALGHERHTARLAAERCVQKLLRACMHVQHESTQMPAAAGAPAGSMAAVAASGPAAAAPLGSIAARDHPPESCREVTEPSAAHAKRMPSGGAVSAAAGAWLARVFRKRFRSERWFQREADRLKGLDARVDALTADMQHESARQRPIVSAFVTFKDAVHKTAALRRAAATAGRLPFLPARAAADPAPGSKGAAGTPTVPLPPFTAGGPPLQLQAPDEPADVMFENLGVSRAEIAVRRATLALLRYAVVLAAFVAASVADTVQNEFEIRGVCFEHCKVYDGAGGVQALTAAQREKFQACHNNGGHGETECTEAESQCLTCYCEALVYSSPLSDLRYCRGNLLTALRVHGSNAALLSITAAVNLVLEAYESWASGRELHSGRTRAQASMAQAQFVAQCLNTVVVAVVADSRVQSMVDLIEARAPFLNGLLFAGLYSDISPNWHRFVGRKMLLTLVIQCVIIVGKTGYTFAMLRWSRRRAKHAATQPDMNRAVQGSDFELAPRYGEVLNNVALAFTFAASLPLLLPLLAVSLAAAYWAQLAELLRASRRPPAQSAALADMALRMVPWLLLLHLAWSLWAFSFSYVREPPFLDLRFVLRYTVLPVGTFLSSAEATNLVIDRVTQANAAPLLAALLLILTVMLGRTLGNVLLIKPLHKPALHVLRALFPAVFNRGASKLNDAIVSFNVAQRTKLLVGPAGYTLAENPHYGDAFSTRHWNPARRRRPTAAASRPGSAQPSAGTPGIAPAATLDEEDAPVQAPAEEWKAEATKAVERALSASDSLGRAHSIPMADGIVHSSIPRGPSLPGRGLAPVAEEPGVAKEPPHVPGARQLPEERDGDASAGGTVPASPERRPSMGGRLGPQHAAAGGKAARKQRRQERIKDMFNVDLNLDTLELPWDGAELGPGDVEPGARGRGLDTSHGQPDVPKRKPKPDHAITAPAPIAPAPKARKRRNKDPHIIVREQDVPTMDSLPLVADLDTEWLTQ